MIIKNNISFRAIFDYLFDRIFNAEQVFFTVKIIVATGDIGVFGKPIFKIPAMKP
jgi:hypothetical protein